MFDDLASLGELSSSSSPLSQVTRWRRGAFVVRKTVPYSF